MLKVASPEGERRVDMGRDRQMYIELGMTTYATIVSRTADV